MRTWDGGVGGGEHHERMESGNSASFEPVQSEIESCSNSLIVWEIASRLDLHSPLAQRNSLFAIHQHITNSTAPT